MIRTPVESSSLKTLGYEHGVLEAEFASGQKVAPEEPPPEETGEKGPA